MKKVLLYIFVLVVGIVITGCSTTGTKETEEVPMSKWFESTNEINISIQEVIDSFNNYGEHYVGVISLMPGLSSVELVEEGSTFISIRTNEGLMKRINISKEVSDDSIIVEFDEDYQAGRSINVKSHYLHKFILSGDTVKHYLVISNVVAPGLPGFFYRIFGKSSTGNATLNTYKTYFEDEKGAK